MLNYKNDSLLFGKETVNDLIRSKNDNLIFLDKKNEILNLFSAFVKKGDFIKKNKINQPLQRTVYVKITDRLRDKIKKRFQNKKNLIKLIEFYIDKRSNLKTAVERWFQNKIFPLIVLRIISRNNKELSSYIKEIEYFTDFLNKSRFYCPKTIDGLLSKKIVYLVGCSVGDGHINKEGKRWTLVDGSSKKERLVLSKEFILNLVNLLSNFVNKHEIKEYETKFALRINNKLFCRFLNFFFGLPFGKKKDVTLTTPFILKYKKEDLSKYFWRGCFDTDGSVNMGGAIDFCSSDENLLKECISYLKTFKIPIKKGRSLIRIKNPHLKEFISIGFSHPRKQKEFLTILKKEPKYKDIRIKDSKLINKRLLQIYNLIRIDSSNYRIRIHSKNLKESKFNEKEIKKIIKDLFGYNLKKTTKNLLYFKSKKVYEHLNKHLISEPYWKSINNKEELILSKEWNEVWN